MKNFFTLLFRAVMSALMVAGALALCMPLIGIAQPTSVLLYTFLGAAVLLTVYEISLAPKI
ncbi:hypothetical protein RU07_18710 [Agrobacterium tumefaciens]|uniref:Uncharacterized protein n=1 Tax=Agrobacterium tumefaciens TaxID=358 RepID=A0A0D0KN90_AGRTU|nr:hypothetical protein RU07_18710 [Agrobacterium tumefaciens]